MKILSRLSSTLNMKGGVAEAMFSRGRQLRAATASISTKAMKDSAPFIQLTEIKMKTPYKGQPKPVETFKQIDIRISMDVPGQFLVNVKADGQKGIRSQVCDSQDEVREFVASIL